MREFMAELRQEGRIYGHLKFCTILAALFYPSEEAYRMEANSVSNQFNRYCVDEGWEAVTYWLDNEELYR